MSMPDAPKDQEGIVPGDRVRVRAAAGGGGGSDWVFGVVVDDFAAEADAGGHEWAPVRRWAVAADDGRLVFADDGDVEPAPPEAM
ncbi:hypothetical protein ACFTWF_24090 [Rhodococcus sp. NPDC056960]|uniref:hypothetical protein n=1 Tax=Rhodococcus sp. NPDC056960 TaxID=3345982 RepID=UPI00363C491A